MVVSHSRSIGRHCSVQAICTMLERVRGGFWEWMLLLRAVVGLLRRAAVNCCGPPPPTLALAITRRVLLLMTSTVVRLSLGPGDILWGCAQRSVGLKRLLQPRRVVVAAPCLGRIGPAVEILRLFGNLDLQTLVMRRCYRTKGPTYPLAA